MRSLTATAIGASVLAAATLTTPAHATETPTPPACTISVYATDGVPVNDALLAHATAHLTSEATRFGAPIALTWAGRVPADSMRVYNSEYLTHPHNGIVIVDVADHAGLAVAGGRTIAVATSPWGPAAANTVTLNTGHRNWGDMDDAMVVDVLVHELGHAGYAMDHHNRDGIMNPTLGNGSHFHADDFAFANPEVFPVCTGEQLVIASADDADTAKPDKPSVDKKKKDKKGKKGKKGKGSKKRR